MASPDGGALQGDGCSDPEDDSGYSAHDLISLGFKKSPSHAALIAETVAISEIDNTHFVVDSMFKPFAIRDGNLITGQQQYSGAAAARLVIEALGV